MGVAISGGLYTAGSSSSSTALKNSLLIAFILLRVPVGCWTGLNIMAMSFNRIHSILAFGWEEATMKHVVRALFCVLAVSLAVFGQGGVLARPVVGHRGERHRT